MKTLVFKVSPKKNVDFDSIVKKMEIFPCRISYDEENSLVIADELTDIMINSVKNFVQKHFTIIKVDIKEEKTEASKVQIAQADTFRPRMSNYDDSDDEELVKLLNKLHKTAKGIVYKKGVEYSKLARHIYTCISEMEMRFFADEARAEFSVGDVVDCYLGYHLLGECEGVHTYCIVCDVMNDIGLNQNPLEDCLVYVVPISKRSFFSRTYMEFDISKDVEDGDDYYPFTGYALLDKGRYVRVNRVTRVVYHLTDEYFSKVLTKLPSAYSFPKLPVNMQESDDEWLANASLSLNKNEKVLFDLVSSELIKLDKYISVEDQVEDFVCNIGMRISDDLLIQSFATAAKLDNISYTTLIPELQKKNPHLKERYIKDDLRDSFNNWLTKNYPDVATNCPKISIISLLKVFAMRFR